MTYRQTAEKNAQYRGQIAELRKQMRAAQAAIEPEQVADYAFTRADGGTTTVSGTVYAPNGTMPLYADDPRDLSRSPDVVLIEPGLIVTEFAAIALALGKLGV